jgi:hypothetical protein
MTKPYDTPDACQYIGTELGYTRLQPTCCSPTLAGKSYCELHYFLVYQKGTAVAKRKKDLRRANLIWDLQDEMNRALEELEGENGI